MLPKEIQEAIDALPAKIKVRVTVDDLGHVLIAPVDPHVEKNIGISNQYDGCGTLYLQDTQQIREFMTDHPGCRFEIQEGTGDWYYAPSCMIGGRFYTINDNGTFYIDSWEFRHMVGGQSD